MGEFVKEEIYPILDVKDLYLPKRAIRSTNSIAFNRLKLSLKDFEKSFNDLRCENLDFIATYRPYHFNAGDFGLYLYAESFCMFLLSILQKSNLDFREAQTLALDAALTHGAFHYLLERYSILAQNYLHFIDLLYPKYKKDIYSKHWGTSKCYEETLANAFIFLCLFNCNKDQENIRSKNYLKYLMLRQREGYCQAVDIDFMNVYKIFTSLELQLGIDRVQQYSHSNNKEMPSLYKYVEAYIPFRYFGLPVFLVNDCRKESDFDIILEIIFPEL